VWDQTPEAVEVELSLPADGAEAKPRDFQVEVKPTHLRVSLRGAVLLEGRLAGKVQSDEGEWQWELAASEDAEDSRSRMLRITLTKRCAPAGTAVSGARRFDARGSEVSYDLGDQWSSLLVGLSHPLIDTQLLSWTRSRPWRPPQDARTRDEVARALPGNRLLDTPVNEQLPGGDGVNADWGSAWRRRKQT